MPRKKKTDEPIEAAPAAAPDQKPKSNRGRKKSKPAAPVVSEAVISDEPLVAVPGKSDYRANPIGYCKDILGITLTPMQQRIYELILQPPYRALVGCGVGVGKSWWGATFINWFFDSFVPSVSLSTAPTTRDIRDVIWAHVRQQRVAAGLGNLVGNVSPELRGEHDKHYAKGFAAEKQESFRGRHERFMGFLFDEATGIDVPFWESARTMFHERPGHHWVCFFNPLDTGCQAYREWTRDSSGWHKIQMGCLDHPNVLAGLRGLPEPFEGAVSIFQVNDWVKKYCDPIDPVDREEGDICWPPPEFATESNPSLWYRPGAYMESNVLGRWPSSDVFGVWSRYAWRMAQREIIFTPTISIWPELGVDIAGKGNDYTAIHGRWGPLSIHHERHNGWTPRQTANRLKIICQDYSDKVNALRPCDSPKIEPEQILVKYDGDGMGYALVDWKGDFNFVPVCGSGTPIRHQQYHNKRAESWFHACQLAKDGRLSVAGIRQEHQVLLEEQLLAPRWTQAIVTGKIVLEDKEETKKRLGGSPDDADALITCYSPAGNVATQAWEVAAQDANIYDIPNTPWRAPTTVPEREDGIPSSRVYDYAEDDVDYSGSRSRWRFGY